LKIYIASSFSQVDKVDLIAQNLELQGHEITVKWWSREYEIPGEGAVKTTDLKVRYEDLDPEDFYKKPETRRSYEADYQGVKDADALVFVAEDTPRAYNGANVELGIALGDGKPCFSLGALDKSVLYYPVFKCVFLEELLDYLESLSRGVICPKLGCEAIMMGDGDGYWCPKCEEYYPPDIVEEWINENAGGPP